MTRRIGAPPQYDQSMTRRITVSLPDHLVDAATAAVREGRASSVSAYVAEALAEKSSAETLEQFLSDWRERVGASTPEETAWAERALGVTPPAAP
jgi:Arc/MetJ-type ribon-helix-helix transcriptional regulator